MLMNGTYHGHHALWLQNELLSVTVLPEKGADIVEFIYRPASIQFLMKTPSGLKPPGSQPPAEFLENYEGGWQELFPNHNDACEYRGRTIPMHGEAALLPWGYTITRDDSIETAVHFQVRCRQTPFLLERTMRLRAGEATLKIESRITNEASEPWEFVWGQHITFGGNFLEAGCRFDAPAEHIITAAELFEPATARLAPGQAAAWPFARNRSGGQVDLRNIPGPDAHSHDDAFLTGFEQGQYTLKNPRLGLQFTLDWDARIFPWLIFWQPFGGSDMPPLTGIYGVGIEPWVSRYPLAQASQARQIRSLNGGESLETTFTASVHAC